MESAMADEFDEEYVQEILAEAAKRKTMTPAEFTKFCRLDWNAGWRDEVREAGRRYFGGGK